MSEAQERPDDSGLTHEESVAAELAAEMESEAAEVETPAEEQPAETETEQEPVQTFEVNGEQVTLDELQKGYLRQSDYTQKTQAVARDREEIESMREALNRFYNEPPTPEWQPEPPQRYPSGEPTGLPEFASDAERVLFERTQRLEQQQQAMLETRKREQAEREMQRVGNTLDSFVAAHPELDEAQVVEISRTIRSRGMPYTQESFDIVHKASTVPDMEAARKQWEADYIARQKAEKAKAEAAALEPGNAPAHADGPIDINSLSEKERDALMANDIANWGG